MNKLVKTRAINAFNQWSGRYSHDVFPKLIKRGYGYQPLAQEIVSYLSPLFGATILEFGTGSGILGKEVYAIRPDLSIIGMDISDKMLRHAKKTESYHQLIQCDAENIPLDPRSYSYGYSAFMMHSLPHSKKFFNEIKRVMTTGSKLGVVDLFKMNTRNIFSKIMDNLHSYRFEHGALSYYLTSKEFLALLKEADIACDKNIALDADRKIARLSEGSMAHHFFGLIV